MTKTSTSTPAGPDGSSQRPCASGSECAKPGRVEYGWKPSAVRKAGEEFCSHCRASGKGRAAGASHTADATPPAGRAQVIFVEEDAAEATPLPVRPTSASGRQVDAGEYIPGSAKERAAKRREAQEHASTDQEKRRVNVAKHEGLEAPQSGEDIAKQMSKTRKDILDGVPSVASIAKQIVQAFRGREELRDGLASGTYNDAIGGAYLLSLAASVRERLDEYSAIMRSYEKSTSKLSLERAARFAKSHAEYADRITSASAAVSALINAAESQFAGNVDAARAEIERAAKSGEIYANSLTQAIDFIDNRNPRGEKVANLVSTIRFYDGRANREEAKRAEREGVKEKITGDRRSFLDYARQGGPVIDPVATSEELTRRTGIRGIQWGEYVGNLKREPLLEKAAAALTDLSDVLGVKTSEIASFGGMRPVALAIGARGHGKASAHYEPGHHVVNLTRDRGDGSLAHEFFHAVDFAGGESIAKQAVAAISNGRPAEELLAASKRGRVVIALPFSRSDVLKDKGEGLELPAAKAAKKLMATMLSEGPAEHARRKRREAENYRALVREAEAGLSKAREERDEAVKKHIETYREALLERARGTLAYRLSKDRSDGTESLAKLENSLVENLGIGDFDMRNPALSARISKLKTAKDTLSGQARIAEIAGDRAEFEARRENSSTLYPSRFLEDATAIDGAKSKKYYSRAEEMCARAFEAYVSRKLAADGGRANTYLTDSVKHYAGADSSDVLSRSAYPTVASGDAERIDKAMEEFLAALKSGGRFGSL